MRVLALVTDSYGGHGGIAKYNRDLLDAICRVDDCERIDVILRNMPFKAGVVAEKINLGETAAKGKFAYLMAYAKSFIAKRYELVICGHINLLPLAYLAAVRNRAKLILFVYGIDVWQPHSNVLNNYLLWRVDRIISISDYTRRKLACWSGLDASSIELLPNAINIGDYGAGKKRPELLRRYGLDGKTIVMTLARLSADERYKGVDEMLELMPMLLEEEPDLVYLVVGDGDDRRRLELKAENLGIADRVIFTGYIDEDEKADHFRLADAFVMVGRGEGFGFVFLEAMACGIPVVASKVDGSREAVLNGKIGLLADPDDKDALVEQVLAALRRDKKVPDQLSYFSFENFSFRLAELINNV